MAEDLIVNGVSFGNPGPVSYGQGNISLGGGSVNGNDADPISHAAEMEASVDGTWARVCLAMLYDPDQDPKYVDMMFKRYAICANIRAEGDTGTYYDIMRFNTGPNKDEKWDGIANKLPSDSFMPILALWHFIKGDGSQMSVPLTSLGVNTSVQNLTPVNSALGNSPGDYAINENFGYNFADHLTENFDQTAITLTLGRISLRTEGNLSIKQDGSWTYNGVVRAFNDTYDANPDPSRGPLADVSTAILDKFKGKPFEIAMPGEIPVEISGKK